MDDPITQAREALAFWNNGRGHADKAWVERHAYNGYAALSALIEHVEHLEAELAEAHTHFAVQEGRIREAREERDEWKAKAEALDEWRELGAKEAARKAPWWHDQGVGIVQGSHWRGGFEAGAAWAGAKAEARLQAGYRKRWTTAQGNLWPLPNEGGK